MCVCVCLCVRKREKGVQKIALVSPFLLDKPHTPLHSPQRVQLGVFSKFTVNLQWYAFPLTQIEKLHRIISGVIRVPLQFPLNGNIAISWRMEMGRMMVVKPAQLLSKRGLLLPAAVGLYKDNWVGNDPLHGPSVTWNS